MLNIIMVNAWNYLGRGQDYVDRLKSGVTRNLTVPHTFHVITEADIPEGVEGWWCKLVLFQPGRFKGRCLFFDLDTVIVGSLDDIAGYKGDFAQLSDLYYPERGASGVLAWDADKAAPIWTIWERAGRPQFHQYGDGGWIDSILPDCDRLQNLYPDQIVSFKAHCKNGVPEGARVVAFHGQPRPHQMYDLMQHWRT